MQGKLAFKMRLSAGQRAAAPRKKINPVPVSLDILCFRWSAYVFVIVARQTGCIGALQNGKPRGASWVHMAPRVIWFFAFRTFQDVHCIAMHAAVHYSGHHARLQVGPTRPSAARVGS